MKITKAFIKNYLANKAGRPLKPKEMALDLNIPKKEYAQFRELLKSMIDEGLLVKLRRGRIGIPSAMNLIVGNISISRKGIGSICPDNDDPLEISPADTFTALDGDKVMVRTEVDRSNNRIGKVIKVIERARKNVLGIFHKGENVYFVTPDARRIRRDVYLAKGKTKKAIEGERVVIKINLWDDPRHNPEGEVIERLGFPGNPKTDIRTIIRKYDLSEDFP
ncbi:MAG: hypothetical protein GY865_08865, partial [candidate division Zixibacteria bacterium]|nr:hypothetical protein [candidate division Zixibacteria bacterium]